MIYYIHYSSNNTLAIISEKEKEKIKNDPLYIWCDKKIQILKYPKIKKKINLFFKLVKKSQFDIVCFGASIAFLNASAIICTSPAVAIAVFAITADAPISMASHA